MSTYSDLNRKDARVRPRVIDIEAILHSVESLIAQPPRQRLFRPEGASLEPLLFQLDGNSQNTSVEWRVKNQVFETIKRDPRVQMVYSQTKVISDPENNTFTLVLVLRLVGFPGTITHTGTIGG